MGKSTHAFGSLKGALGPTPLAPLSVKVSGTQVTGQNVVKVN